MIEPLLRGDIRRCLTSAGLPAIALIALVRIRLSLAAAGDRPIATLPTEGLRIAVTAAIVLATVWFVLATTRAVISPRRDAHAADRLRRLREWASWPGHSLWEIQSTEWASEAGQRAVCVNVQTGEAQPLWLEQAHLARGTFVLILLEEGRHRLIDWLDVSAVTSAGRHRRWETFRADRRSANTHRATHHLQRTEVDRVIQQAENLLRGN